MCDLFVNLDDFFTVVCMSFHELWFPPDMFPDRYIGKYGLQRRKSDVSLEIFPFMYLPTFYLAAGGLGKVSCSFYLVEPFISYTI